MQPTAVIPARPLENPLQRAERLLKLRDVCLSCTACELSATRTKLVFGDGNSNAWVMFIGEAPGQEENRQGIPFCGRSGQLLRKMIAAIGLTSEDWYIANIIKDRPPGNRVPEKIEIETCIRFLHKQIEIICPQLLVLLGRTAVKGLMPNYSEIPLDVLREQTKSLLEPILFEGIRVLVTYHPSALLRDPNKKPKALADFRYIEAMVRSHREIIESPL